MRFTKVHLALAVTLVIGLLIGMALAPIVNAAPQAQKTLQQQYAEAVERAMTGAQGTTFTGLNPINDANPRLVWNESGPGKGVLVLTWTKYPGSYHPGEEVNCSWGETWVTVIPDMEEFFAGHVSKSADLTLRAEELLGGPTDWNYTYFVEAYVQPSDLFRPAGDNEICDTTASTALPSDAEAWYKSWFNGNIVSSYYPEKFPWTRLGYTYDWGSTTHIGLSEYVIKKGATIQVLSVTPTAEYLNGFYAS
jgi:type II secretory pathway pseudopilin PulG